MTSNDHLTPRQQLGRRLRQARETVPGLQAKQVAEAIGISADLASRFETGQRWPNADHVRAWARATSLDENETAELLDLLADTRERDKALKSTAAYGPKAAQAARNKLLSAATRIRTFAVAEIPFYLQSAEYARQEIGDTPDAGDITDMRVAASNEVGRAGKHFEIILTEAALRFLPCDPATMRGQISRLHGLVGAPGVEFGVIPFGVELVTPLKNAFSVFDDTTVIDTFAGEVTLTPKESARYLDLMARLWEDAVRGEPARELLTAATNALANS